MEALEGQIGLQAQHLASRIESERAGHGSAIASSPMYHLEASGFDFIEVGNTVQKRVLDPSINLHASLLHTTNMPIGLPPSTTMQTGETQSLLTKYPRLTLSFTVFLSSTLFL